jgi:hypothetical protein
LFYAEVGVVFKNVFKSEETIKIVTKVSKAAASPSAAESLGRHCKVELMRHTRVKSESERASQADESGRALR